MNILEHVRIVPDFPKEGIQFYDITTLLQNPVAYRFVLNWMEEQARALNATVITAIDARGFLFGAALADRLQVPLVLARKPGKLPASSVQYSYELEYGTDTLCMHEDALQAGDRVVIVDDLLATGGTVHAVAELVQQLQAEVVGMLFVINLHNLNFLPKRTQIKDYDIRAVVSAEG